MNRIQKYLLYMACLLITPCLPHAASCDTPRPQRLKIPAKVVEAANNGNAAAQYTLGECYMDGIGVARNDATAAKWFRKSADKGFALAQCNLGYLYKSGRGVPVNFTEAAKWYRKAAEQGDAMAQFNLGTCYMDGEGVTKSYMEAVKWFRKAANMGYTGAQYYLADCLANGRGVRQDNVAAYMWAKLAVDGGQKEALPLQRGLAANMPPEQIAEAKRFAAAWRAAKQARQP